MRQVFLGEDADDMPWLQSQYSVPADMTCAILTGNEDSPERIEAWRTFNPDYRTPPDYTWEAPPDVLPEEPT